MLEAAHGGVLLRSRGGVEGVNFDDPAEGVGLVGVAGIARVEARLVEFPLTRGRLRRYAVTLVAVAGARCGKVAVEVLLAGKDSSPWSGSAGAVAQGSLDPAAFRVIDCLDQVGSCSSARQFVDVSREDAAIQGCSLNIVPRLVLVLPFQLHHRQAVPGPANCTG